jgi:hypothetical protein
MASELTVVRLGVGLGVDRHQCALNGVDGKLDNIRKWFAHAYGGCNIVLGRGSWLHDGQVWMEESATITFAIDSEDARAADGVARAADHAATIVGKLLNQHSVYVEHYGRARFVEVLYDNA